MKKREVLEDDKRGRQLIAVQQEGTWKFLVFSGTLHTNLLVDQNRRTREVNDIPDVAASETGLLQLHMTTSLLVNVLHIGIATFRSAIFIFICLRSIGFAAEVAAPGTDSHPCIVDCSQNTQAYGSSSYWKP